jgi:SAM-dependent methyltransferase
MEHAKEISSSMISRLSPIHDEDAFSRPDNTDDRIFYARERCVSHLDTLALETVEQLIGALIVEEAPSILDLMAGWDSHLPEKLQPSRVVGLGLNEEELKNNKALNEYVIHDLNRDPGLPFPDQTFHAVINTVSVDYMTRPIPVFEEVARILKPGGLFLVIFSNRMFPQKAVKVWREASEDERVILVEEFFRASEAFEKPGLFVSREKPRPKDDKYAHLGIPSDPIYAVYADRKGAAASRSARPTVVIDVVEMPERAELERRKRHVGKTLRCPYCDHALKKWAVPDNPFAQTWDNEFMYICFNDACPYFLRGWDRMYRDTNQGMSYRFLYNPHKDTCSLIPVPTPNALKEGIIESPRGDVPQA